jgi:subtilisin family serine protease
VVIRNNVGGPPIAMAQDGTPNQPTIPGVMVSNTTGVTLTAHGGEATTIGATKTYVQDLATSNVLAGFSSRGPTDVDFRVKPDVTAPGVNVLSSIPGSGPESCVPTFPAPCWAFFQGTSMATPHLAGSAAFVISKHPTWPAWAVRSAVVNTADENVLKTSNGTCCDVDVNDVGSGRENLNSAVHASLGLDPVSVSFGAVPSGSGQTDTRTVQVTNLTGGTLAVPAPTITGTTGTGVAYSVSGGALSLSAGGSTTFTVTMTASKGAGLGAHQAILRFGSLEHAAVFTWIK